MSLNGLEATEVNEAYQSALGEGGGWFLLKYTSRDEVGLLERGSGGITEVKEAVDRYEEQSPLFGFIQYRRRKVILKFLPEGTSRLLQARVTVQFQSVTEKFTPHDTIYPFANSSDLRDSKLSSACSLHTASDSGKDSNESLPRGGPAEISEDTAESPIDDNDGGGQIGQELKAGEDRRPGKCSTENTNGRASPSHHHSMSPSITTRPPLRPRASSNVDKDLPSTPGEDSHDKPDPRAIFHYGETESIPVIDGRFSSQSARPSARDLDNFYEYKPKVKLGPRPSIDSSIARFDKTDAAANFRPVSTLPAGLRMPPRNMVSGRPKSSQTQSSFSDRLSSRQPLPPAPITPIQIPDRKLPVPSNGLPTPTKTPDPKSPKMTPEKRRLMKALQIRQKQLAAQKPASGIGIGIMPTEERITKSEPEDPVISPKGCEATPPAESDLVHVSIRDLNREEQRKLDASPISLPETCEGPSTQASSIMEEENINGQKTQESNAVAEAKISEKNYLEQMNDVADAVATSQGFENMSSGERAHDARPSQEVIRSECRQDAPPLSSPASQPPPAEVEQSAEKGHSKVDIQAPTIDERPVVVDSPPSMSVKALGVGDSREEILSQSTLSRKVGKAIEQSPQHLGTTGSQETHKKGGSIETLKASSFESAHIPLEEAIAREVPLPPIDETEEITLSPQHAQQALPVQKLSSKPEAEEPVTASIDKRSSQDSDLPNTRPSFLNTIGAQQLERRVPRQDVVNPIERDSTGNHSEDQFLADDSFMEELKSATVQEAKPVSVSKSPIKPVFPRTESEQRLVETRAARSVSSPLTHQPRAEETLSSPPLPAPSSCRSFSASQTPRLDTQQLPPSMPKKLGVSTGISQRIKALEQLSARPTSPSSVASSPNPSAFVSLRKTSQQTTSSLPDPGRGDISNSRPKTAYPSPSSSPEAVKYNPFKHFTSKVGNSRTESVSVTAAIIRDAKNKIPEPPLKPSEPRAMELHQSPLVVEHEPMAPPSLLPLKPPRPRYARYSSARSGSSSSTDYKEVSTTASPARRRDSFASIRSKSSRAASEAELPRTISDSSTSGPSSPDGTKDEKKDSKRSRLMKRMSNISSMSRRSIAQALSPSPKESPIMEHHEPVLETPSSSVEVGDVNIQFPDTLLWKRRHMVIDDQGILVLSASKSDNNSKVITKRYALSQFRTPYLPDQDRQELPHSVILDFIDGSTLQCACEHPQGQAGVLQALRQAHSVWQTR